MTYFLRKKKWMAWVVLLTFLFTSFMPSNLLAGNSVAEAAISDSKTVAVGETLTLTGSGYYSITHEWTQTSDNGGSVTFEDGKDSSTVTLKGKSAGTVTITHRWGYYNPNSETFTVTVTGNAPVTPPEVQGDVALGKTAERVGADEWKITMTIGADSQTIEAEPYNIVLVIDRSNSMTDNDSKRLENARAAAKNFVDQISVKKMPVNIGVVSFNQKATTNHRLTSVSTKSGQISQNVTDIKTSINGIETTGGYDGGTNIHDGLIKAYSLLAGKPNAYIILLSDGLPTHYINANGDVGGNGSDSTDNCKNYATDYVNNTIKPAGVNLITIAFDCPENAKTFYEGLATKPEYAKESGIDDINSIFSEIADQLLYVMASGIVTDDMGADVDIVLGEDGLTSDDYEVSIGTVTMGENGKLVWNIPDKVTKDRPATLTYIVKAKNLSVGKQEPVLNGQAGLAYKDSNDESHSATFENPVGTYEAGQLVVSYNGLPSTVTPSWTDGYTVDADGTWKSAVKVTDYPNEPATVSFPSVNDVADYQVSSVTVTLPDGASETLTLGEFNTKYTGNSLTLQKGMSSIVYHYTTSVTLTKVDGDANNALMQGVTFTLTENATQANIAVAAITGKYTQVKQTDVNGQVTFDGLELGKSYTLSETAPNGYKTKGPWTLIVNADGTVTISGSDGVISGNQIVNERCDDLSYKVNYLEKDTNEVLAEAKVVNGQTFGAKVTEKAIDIAGYNKVDPTSATIEIKVENNVINFYYTKRTDLSYTVNYLEKDTNEVLAEAKVVNGQTFGAKVTEKAIDIAGYNKVDPTSATIEIKVENNVINLYYTAIDYTVSYEYEGTVPTGAAEQLPAPTDKNHVNTSIEVAEEPSISGYVFSGWTVKAPEGITISDGTFTMPANDVVLVGSWTLAGDTAYTVNYYYQNQDGTYGEPLSTETLATTTGALVFADTMPNGNHVTTPSLYQFNPNATETVTQATVAADGTTVLNVFFDQVYRVVYKYTDGSVFNYVIDDTGYIFNRESNFVAPMLNWDANTGADFDNVWYDNAVPENGQKWDTWNIAAAIASGSAAFDKATNTLTLYTTAKVSVVPTITGQLNVAKLVNDKGNKTNGNEEFKFELKITEIKQSQVLDPLTKDEAEKLHHYNSENRNAQAANEKAQEDWRNAVEAFKGHATTTASALSFVIADDNNVSLYGVTTGSEMGWISYDGWTAFDCQGEAIAAGSAQETVLNKIVEFVKDFAAAGKAMPSGEEATKLFVKDMMDYAGVATGSAITFHNTDLYELYDVAGVASMTKDAAEKKASVLEAFLKEINRWIDPDIKVVFGNETHSLSEYKNADGTYTIPFTLKDKETLGFDFKVTTGSVISYVISEVDAQGADSTDIKSNTGTEYVNKLFVEGSFEVTTNSFLGYTFTNNYNGSSSPVDPWDPWTPPTDPEDPIDIEDPDVPLAEPDVDEPDIEIEDPDVPLVDVPGEPIEIEEPEVPLGDAPKTGDSSNAIPFVVLMMVAGIGLAITRRKFN